MDVNYELQELEKRYSSSSPKVNSFYEEMSPMSEPAGSAKFLGDFTAYGPWYIDKGSNKLMRRPL